MRRLGFAVAAISVVTLAACGGDNTKASGDVPNTDRATEGSAAAGGAPLPAAELAIVAYSTPQAAYEKITKAFQQTAQGKETTFTLSFGGSGDQSRAVAAGQTADIVAFSLEPDISRLVKASLVATDWNAGAAKGMITDSVVVIVVRKGNPKNIKSWADLTKPGIEVITPNPFASGGARWNVMAAYGQAIKTGGSEQQGIEYLNALFKNVPVQDDSARKALATFTSGKGDAMIAYENEAIFAQQQGQAIDYIVPDSTILIENPVAVTSMSKHPEQAKAFLDYLHGPEAQSIFAENGYRPIVTGVTSSYPFPTPAGLFTIADFGGWTEVTSKFFDPAGGIMATVEEGIGVSVGS